MLQPQQLPGPNTDLWDWQIQGSCRVITQCRTHALKVGEPYGIWGGLSESERELLLKGGLRRRTA
jgi:WhiB family redox-sensing transcriptional regulator